MFTKVNEMFEHLCVYLTFLVVCDALLTSALKREQLCHSLTSRAKQRLVI